MGHMNPIKAQDIKVGDILFVTTRGGFAFTNQEVVDLNPKLYFIGTKSTDDGVAEGFGFNAPEYTFYLIERPKKPLPTAIGSVVEVDGVKYVRVLEDYEDCCEWAFREGDCLEEVSSAWLAGYDFTVV